MSLYPLDFFQPLSLDPSKVRSTSSTKNRPVHHEKSVSGIPSLFRSLGNRWCTVWNSSGSHLTVVEPHVLVLPYVPEERRGEPRPQLSDLLHGEVAEIRVECLDPHLVSEVPDRSRPSLSFGIVVVGTG